MGSSGICDSCGTYLAPNSNKCPNCGTPRTIDRSKNDSNGNKADETGLSINTEDRTKTCPYCREEIKIKAKKCKHCGSSLVDETSGKSNALAGCLGLFLGPVGLWYKGRWAAGFAWLVMAIIFGALTYGLVAPLFWIGMAVHAAKAEPK